MRWRHYHLLTIILPIVVAIADAHAEAPSIESRDNSLSFIVYEPELLIDKKVAIKAYRDLLNSAPELSLRHLVMRRIADLQMALAEDNRPKRWEKPSTEGHLDEAEQLYNNLLQAFPDDPEADDILYNLAHAYDNADRNDRTLAILDRLIKSYPDSPYRAEARFRRAEILFRQKDFLQAAAVYEDIVSQNKKSPFYVESLYKLGWSLFSQGDYERALDSLLMVLDTKLAPGGRFVKDESLRALASEDQALVQDTMRVINISFTYLEETHTIAAYLKKRRQRPYDDLIYNALAQRYLDKERYTDAAATYAAFVELNPEHPEAPYYQIKVYETQENAGFRSLAWTSKQGFVTRYGFNSTFWLNHDIKQYPIIVSTLKKNLVDLAQHLHAKAQASGDLKDFNDVAKMYSEYLSLFPADPSAPHLNFLLAELLNETGRYQEAIKEYERTAYGYRRHEKAAEAGYAALILTNEQALNSLPGKQAIEDQKRIERALKFTTYFPDHPETATVLVRTAEDLFSAGDFDRALTLTKRTLQLTPPPKEKLRQAAWTIQGHILFDRKNYENAAQAYEVALLLTKDNDDHKQGLEDRLAASLYKQGEIARAQGDTEQMVEYFLRTQSVSPESDFTATALYDAGAALITLQKWDQAIQTLEQYRTSFPQHNLREDVTRKLAYAYLQGGHSVKAADEYFTIGNETSDTALKKEALWQAAELYEQAEQTSDATMAYQRYVEAFPYPLDQAQQARMRLIALAVSEGYSHQQRYWMNKIIEADEMASSDSSDFSRELAASAALQLAEPIRQIYQDIRLVTPLEKNLQTKKRAMESALEAYGKAIDYHIAEVTTAATYHIGEIYHDFSISLLESQRPPGLSSDEREEYDVLLEEEAYPFEEEAIKLHESNVSNIQQGIYDNWIKESINRLAELLPARYDKSEKWVKFVKTIN